MPAGGRAVRGGHGVRRFRPSPAAGQAHQGHSPPAHRDVWTGRLLGSPDGRPGRPVARSAAPTRRPRGAWRGLAGPGHRPWPPPPRRANPCACAVRPTQRVQHLERLERLERSAPRRRSGEQRAAAAPSVERLSPARSARPLGTAPRPSPRRGGRPHDPLRAAAPPRRAPRVSPVAPRQGDAAAARPRAANVVPSGSEGRQKGKEKKWSVG